MVVFRLHPPSASVSWPSDGSQVQSSNSVSQNPSSSLLYHLFEIWNELIESLNLWLDDLSLEIFYGGWGWFYQTLNMFHVIQTLRIENINSEKSPSLSCHSVFHSVPTLHDWLVLLVPRGSFQCFFFANASECDCVLIFLFLHKYIPNTLSRARCFLLTICSSNCWLLCKV